MCVMLWTVTHVCHAAGNRSQHSSLWIVYGNVEISYMSMPSLVEENIVWFKVTGIAQS